MKLLSWNVRGLGKSIKRRKIKKLLFERKVDVALFQETKRPAVTDEFVRSCWPGEQMAYMAVDSEGAAGGLLCVWNPQVFQLLDCCCNRYFIILSGTLFTSIACVIVNVYGPTDGANRKGLWETLKNLKRSFVNPWCLGGDFNEIRTLSERVGCSQRSGGMKDFNELIDNLEVCDLPMLGRKFIWCNSQNGLKWSRLERFLISPDWLQKFNFKLWGLPRRLSDHCPILMMEDERDWGPKPFKFLNAWCLHPQFKIFVQKIWAESHVNGWAGFKCLRKLRLLKAALKRWNLEVFGKVDFKLKQLEEEIHVLDLVAEQRLLTDAERSTLRELKGEAWNLSKMVEWLWLQKSRANWLLKGDRNTKFFHVMASTRRNRNALCSIEVNGALTEDPKEIRTEVFNHFQRQFSESWFDRPSLYGPFKSIGVGEARAALEAEFT
ncbi:uncharacterized protein LOC114286280 [Camellia sinensis]|uniref:uncharacterized protein LOC114286280 n=1 Tax=Camellia sinensis TaxID=4442 RepID=UPI001036DBB5|nr:uncharacterized protein LOC114286280 [Camellia sinensis]